MAKRDPERTRKIRVAVRYLIDHGCLYKGNQSRLAEHFQVSRQRVHQIVVEERNRDRHAGRVVPPSRPMHGLLDSVNGGYPHSTHARGA
jgi:hypothetical protein